MQLVLRTEVGSSFHAKFYIKSANTSATAGNFLTTQVNDSLWWEFDGLVTNCATSFAPGDIIVSRVDFVTTGAIRLRARTTSTSKLLQENGSAILLEQGGFLLLEDKG
jgi:hypothetical protein